MTRIIAARLRTMSVFTLFDEYNRIPYSTGIISFVAYETIKKDTRAAA